jgi:hypothetical protein
MLVYVGRGGLLWTFIPPLNELGIRTAVEAACEEWG